MSEADPSRIPDCTEAISTEWLSAAVQERAPGAQAKAVRVIDAHSGTTGRARLRVTWETGDLPELVFAKLAPTDPIQRAMAVATGMGAREAHFYSGLANEVPVRVPRPLGAQWTEDGQTYIMLLEDLASSGCEFPDFHSGADIATLRSVIEELARLHAAYWESPRFDTDLAWIQPPMHGEGGRELVAAGVEKFGAEQPAAFHAMARLYIDHCNDVAELLAAGPRTLMHGDSHLGNLFLEDGRIGFLDWACVCRGPGLRDVAYFLSNSVEIDLRRAEQEALLRHYLETLAAEGAPAPGFADAWRGYRRFVAYGWISAVATYAAGARMQSLAVGRRGVARANAAIADLSTAELIREELGLPGSA